MSHSPDEASKSSARNSASRVPATATRPEGDGVTDEDDVNDGEDVGEAPNDSVVEGEPEPLADALPLAEADGVGTCVCGAEGVGMKLGAPPA